MPMAHLLRQVRIDAGNDFAALGIVLERLRHALHLKPHDLLSSGTGQGSAPGIITVQVMIWPPTSTSSRPGHEKS